MAKILILDIETSPNVAYVWRFFKENISPKQVLEHGYIMSFAAKWLDSDEVFYVENRKNKEKPMLRALYKLLDQADIVVAHNGNRFDLPKIRGRGLVHGLNPPSPYKTVDTCLVARRQFGFESNSLEYLCNVLDLPRKLTHKKFPGFELWLECLKGNEEAWEEMREYNIHDIVSLEALYLRVLPYVVNHPNVGVFTDDEVPVCPKCGSDHLQRRGYAHTNVGKYRKMQCQSCFGWSRTRYTENTIDKRKSLVTNVGG